MNSTLPRITVPAATTAVVAWALKALAIGTAGGLDQSPLESPLFFVGLLAFLIAAASLAWGVAAARPVVVRVLASVGAIILVFATAAVTSSVSQALAGSSTYWVWSEVSLWIASLALLAIVLRVRRGSTKPMSAVPRAMA
jgi:hypothetical protein